jgi:hypothetical protein
MLRKTAKAYKENPIERFVYPGYSQEVEEL